MIERKTSECRQGKLSAGVLFYEVPENILKSEGVIQKNILYYGENEIARTKKVYYILIINMKITAFTGAHCCRRGA